MSIDIVEIALDNLTDHVDFEKLASEIMRDEGYPAIKPLGGVTDIGQDAISESFFINSGRNVTVFQYTLEQYLPGKIKDTIEKLTKGKIEYNELVIVTPRAISSERQDHIKRQARNDFDVSVDIFERKTIVNRLSKFENGMFSRHFPDIDKQVATAQNKNPILSPNDATILELAMLKSALTFTVNADSPRVRDSVFDSLTFTVVSCMQNGTGSKAQILKRYKELTGMKLESAQLDASIKRLALRGLVTEKATQVSLTKDAKQTEAASTIKANENTESFIADIVHQVEQVFEQPINPSLVKTMSDNTRNALIKLFRLFGLELSNQILKKAPRGPDYLEQSDDLVKTATNNLPQELANLLVATISQVIKNPTEEQAITLSYWSLSYLGIQIMHLDPTLSELQMTRFSQKIFVLDTDFILDCIVKEGALSSTYLTLLTALSKYGCKLIIPESCIDECITHAKISTRTYDHFGEKLLNLNDAFADEVVWNAFVKGYYYGRKSALLSPKTTFIEYLKNYYEPRSTKPFFLEVIKSTFPKDTQVVDMRSLLPTEIPTDTLKSMSDQLLRMHSSALKSKYRSADDIKQLATTDAVLFLSAVCLSDASGQISEKVLGGCCYIITSSAKYMTAANKVGLKDIVTTRPQTLAALLKIIGGIKIDSRDFVQLFENPLLIYAVQQAWADVEVLLDSGIDLRDKSLTRLRFDLDQELHGRISALQAAEAKAETEGPEIAVSGSDTEYIELIRSASSRGYKKIPELDKFMKELDGKEMQLKQKDDAYDDLMGRFSKLEDGITHFGKRKQRYLRRIASQQNKKS